MPVPNTTVDESKATAVFLNSNSRPPSDNEERRQGRSTFRIYNPKAYANIRIPDIKNDHIRRILVDCWEPHQEHGSVATASAEVRRLWDETVAEAMGWNPDELAHLRELLNTEPHVRGLGYNQYADEMEDIEDMETDPDDETAEDQD